MLKIPKEYIAVIEKEKNSDYGIIFPDFLGCVSVGKTLEEAKNMAEEALQFHIDGMLADGEDIPHPTSLDKIKAKYKKAEAFLIVPTKIATKAARINITIDEKLLRKLDKYLNNVGENRSSFFANAIREKAVSA
jgi:predicted RNase H-like HicB family nuclease